MRELSKLRFILFFSLLSSCISEDGIYIEVDNLSDQVVKDVKIQTTDQKSFIEFDSITAQERIEVFLDMKATLGDGGYIINFTWENGNEYKTGGGYYTNGNALDRKILFKIENDTVLVSTPIF